MVRLDQAHGALHDRCRAAVVDLEVDAPEARQRVAQLEDASHVGEPPAVDRLVVVTDQEHPVGGCGQQERQPQLRPIHVLDLVDQQVPAAAAPAREERRIGVEPVERPPDEIVEVEGAARRECPLVRHERPAGGSGVGIGVDLGGVHAELQLEPRERGVEPADLRRVAAARTARR